MSDPQATNTLIPAEPTLKDALDFLKKEMMLQFSAHHIATIQVFDATDQTATATIAYQKTYFQRNAVGQYTPVLKSYPLMLDCPVIFLGGGPTSLRFPVTPGDQCLALFNDRDIDNWFQGSNSSANATNRLHSFSDAILLVGLRSQLNSLSSFDIVRAMLIGGTGVVGVNPTSSKILITNSSPVGSSGIYTYPVTLGTILGAFFTATAAATTVAQVAAAAATAETALVGLLE